MFRSKFKHLKLPHTVIPDRKQYDLIIYENENKQFYFFGHTILWCLGYEVPHVSLKSLVPDHERHTIPLGSGVYLNESTVQRLITERKQNSPHPHYDSFEKWLTTYLKNCKGMNPSTNCP